MPAYFGSRRLWTAFAAALCGIALAAAAAAPAAAQQPTREEIIEALKGRLLTRCPHLDALRGCGARPAVDVEVYFDNASARLNPAALAQVSALGLELEKPERKGVTYLIVGHADASGGARYNQRLSERRAEMVKRILLKEFKLPSDMVTVVGRGKTEPKHADTPYDAENRRVEIMNTERK